MLLPLELRAGLALAAVAAALFGWHRVAESYREQGRQECRIAAAKELKENTDALARISAQAQADQYRREAAAVSVRDAGERLRHAVAGAGLVIRPASAPASAPAPDTDALLSDVLGRLEGMARLADERGAAGAACEAAYDAVSR